MEATNKYKSIMRFINLFLRNLVAIVIALCFTGIGTLFAQTDTVSNVNAPNEAMKSVFQQLKKEVKTNDTLSSILMIIGVILIVGVAVYLSFKSDPEDKKPPLKSSATKKA